MVGEGNPFYLKFWVNRPPLERNRRFRPRCSEIADFNRYSLLAPQP